MSDSVWLTNIYAEEALPCRCPSPQIESALFTEQFHGAGTVKLSINRGLKTEFGAAARRIRHRK
jgi:hypothetical protein